MRPGSKELSLFLILIFIISCILQTPKDHSDWHKLEQAISRLQDIIEEVDRKTGEAKVDCFFFLNFGDNVQLRTHLLCLFLHSAFPLILLLCFLPVPRCTQ